MLLAACLPCLLSSLAAAQVAPLQVLLDQAVRDGATRLELPPGRIAVPGHLLLAGADGLTIDGTGTTLVFSDWRGVGWSFNSCRDVTIRGLTIDYDPLPFVQGRITARAEDGAWVDFEVAVGYPGLQTEQLDTYRQAYLFEPDRPRWKAWVPDLYGRVEITDARHGRFVFWRPPALWRLIEPNDRIAFTIRTGAAIRMNDCEDVTVDRVTIHAAPGAALLGRYMRGDNRFRYDIVPGEPPPGAVEPRLISTCADGFNIAFATRGPTLEGCHFSFMGDDSVNLHGVTLAVLRRESPTELIVGWPYGPEFLATVMPAGAAVRRLRPDNWEVTGTAPLASFEPLPEMTEADRRQLVAARLVDDPTRGTAFRLRLATPLEAEPGEFVDVPGSNSPGFVIRGNVFEDHRARGCRVMASDGVIEGNVFRRLKMCAISLGNEYGYWREAGWVEGVTVRGNLIEEVGHDAHSFAAENEVLGAISVFSHHDRGVTAPYWPGNRDIVIEGNTIRDVPIAGIFANAVRGLTVRGNHLERVLYGARPGAGAAMGLDVSEAIDLRRALDVTAEGNSIVGLGQAPAGLALPD